MKKQNLIICPIGQGSLHKVWLNKRLNADVLFIHYDNETMPVNAKGISVNNVFMKGSKFTMIKELWNDKKIDRNYKYYTCLDDDILISTEQINRFFEIAKEEKLNIFHPCLQPLHHNCTQIYKQPGRKVHFINWIELQCIGFTNKMFKKALPYFDENVSSWGLPQVWYKEFKIKDLYGIIDEIEIIHTRAMGSAKNTIYTNIKGDGKIEAAQSEFFSLMIKYGIKESHIEETRYPVLDRPLMSVNIITCDRDIGMVEELLETLPDWCEVIMFHTKAEAKANEFELKSELENLKIYEYRYTGKYLNYDIVRNLAIEQSKGLFIMHLDSDERLLIHQHTNLHQALLDKSLETITGGIAMDVISSQTVYKSVSEKQVRIFKNIPEIRYEGSVYENPHWQLEEAGYKVYVSDFRIDHIGYRGDVNDMEDKLKARIETVLLRPQVLFDRPSTFDFFIRDCKNYDNFKNKRLENEKESCNVEK